ncbi:HIRAN domain-containing protein [Anabaenopsis tanganyikae CS-531]|uniref:HIRAN domain-containing protein n=2 Tax=Anabaenopsis TaxID=110103 RepID=A0ABT5AR75_9CYAN|nr:MULTISPECIES: HIRAN domain-containing protein [Anabaenopsis]MDB9538956.1 HIRAN domain-containing protein [Anabaenopsis arnoldii]MDH6091244.1 HIRAN domain-containing protein [Anabaenopsis arnoldii]MDH6105291.1 HIRAN domain-containing protein [Anabaenopsis tanganyikae CS-531]
MKTLFLAWQDTHTRAWFPIGRLTFDGRKYEFLYTKGVLTAKNNCGFTGLLSFPDFNQVYTSVDVFPLFSNRLMRRSRPDYKNYIEWLNIPEGEDDPITILSRSGGRKVTDKFEVFPAPQPDQNNLYHIHFFAHGLRHLPTCATERINQLQPRELLYLAHEFQNPYDPKALLLCTREHHIVGYCPRYLVDDILQLTNKNPQVVKVHVERVNPAPTPLQLRLLCNVTAEWPENFRPFSGQEYQPIIADIPAGNIS